MSFTRCEAKKVFLMQFGQKNAIKNPTLLQRAKRGSASHMGEKRYLRMALTREKPTENSKFKTLFLMQFGQTNAIKSPTSHSLYKYMHRNS